MCDEGIGVYVDLVKDIDGMYLDLDMYDIKHFLTYRNLLVQLSFYFGLFVFKCMKSIVMFKHPWGCSSANHAKNKTWVY